MVARSRVHVVLMICHSVNEEMFPDDNCMKAVARKKSTRIHHFLGTSESVSPSYYSACALYCDALSAPVHVSAWLRTMRVDHNSS